PWPRQARYEDCLRRRGAPIPRASACSVRRTAPRPAGRSAAAGAETASPRTRSRRCSLAFDSPHYGYCAPIQAAAVTRAAAVDAERFATWQRDTLEARAVDSEVLTIGPFRVALAKDKAAPGGSWGTLGQGRDRGGG